MKLTTAKNNADTRDIMYYLAMAAPSAIKQVKEMNLAQIIGLEGANVQKDAELTGKWIRSNIKYKQDGFEEQNIQFPSAILKSKAADCKSLSLLYLAIMSNAGHVGGFRFASYRPSKQITHVYNFFKDGKGDVFTYDACIKNLKESNKATYIKDMKVNYIAGVPVMIEETPEILSPMRVRRVKVRGINGVQDLNTGEIMSEPEFIGRGRLRDRLKKAWEKVKDAANKAGKTVLQPVKKVYLVVPRQSFRALVALNFRGFASRLDRLNAKDPDKLKEFWNKFGGNYGDLMSAINSGKKKKPLLIKKGSPKLNETINISGPNGIGVEPTTTAAAIAGATPIILAVVQLLKKMQVPPTGEEAKDNDGELPPPDGTGDGTGGEVPELPPGGKFTAADPEGDDAEAYTKSGGQVFVNTKGQVVAQPRAEISGGNLLNTKNLLILGGVAAGIFLLTRKKR